MLLFMWRQGNSPSPVSLGMIGLETHPPLASLIIGSQLSINLELALPHHGCNLWRVATLYDN